MKLLKSYSEKEIKRIMPLVNKINSLEDGMKELSDEELSKKTDEYRERYKNGETLDDLLPEAFATMREASRRVLNMRHFDVQLIGGIVLHQGRIAEMKTGEGKTLVATLPVYLNALTGEGVHVITVNDYLATRDSEWMGKVYKFLNVSVGLCIAGMKPDEKRAAYDCDVTYGTNNEFGFDYLRDNMVIYKSQLVQRKLKYAIVDEVDSILIDEARTPLIISGQANKSSEYYKKADKFVKSLHAKTIIEEDVKDEEQEADNEKYDYIIDLKAKSASLTLKGVKKAEEFFGVENFNDIENSELVHAVNQALRANGIMKNEVDYIVKDGQVLIVDEFTGRIMYGRRYNNGLHQAIEAKEGVKVADESKTLATITFQNYFRMYEKLSGMTGTAMTEKDEFQEIYHLDSIEIPTNKPMIREDHKDIIYKNEKVKFEAVIEDIKESHEKGQPVLVGTVSIDKSEKLSKMLKEKGIEHQVLNAKYYEKEAQIVAQAGKLGAVTISTNMAGRGTDIMLGGNSEYLAKEEMAKSKKYSPYLIEQASAFNETDDKEILDARKKYKELKDKYEEQIEEEKEKVIEAGGLKIIGTSRHESRRIDNQLRGRAGRQGDPGESRFYISLEDDLMKIFGGDKVRLIYEKIGVEENMPIENKIITRAVESAQSKIESRNFSIRKNVLEYDDVMNVQREVIYNQRRDVLDGENLKEDILGMVDEVASSTVATYFNEEGEVDKEGLKQEIITEFGIFDTLDSLKEDEPKQEEVEKELIEKAHEIYEQKEKDFGEETMRELERIVVLKIVDSHWMDHIDAMDELKNGIGLQAYGQKDPVVQYRIVGNDMAEEMSANIKIDVVKFMMNARKREGTMRREEQITNVRASLDDSEGQTKSGVSDSELNDAAINLVDGNKKGRTIVNSSPKIGRNDPCPCGSGKKYKNCCGKNA